MGTNSGDELDRQITCVQAAIMMIRLLGAEKEATNVNYSLPFIDIPGWAEDAIAYLYSKGFPQGASISKFQSQWTM